MGSDMLSAVGRLAGIASLLAWLACAPAHAKPVTAVIHDPPSASVQHQHRLRWSQLKALAGARPRASRLLGPPLARVLGSRYQVFKASLPEEKRLRVEGTGLVGEGVVPNTLGYRGAFFVFGRQGGVFAVIKGGRHGTVIQQFGSPEVLGDPVLLHAYQEFVGIDE
jgi:hypothetical protein